MEKDLNKQTDVAENTDVETKAEDIKSEEGKDEKATEPKTLTDILKNDKNIASEFDRRITEAIEKGRNEASNDIDAKIQNHLNESKKLEQMTEDEKREYEYEQKLAKLEEKERELELKELKATASLILADRNLDASWLDVINFDGGADVVKSTIDLIEKTVSEQVKNEVNNKLGREQKLPVGKQGEANVSVEQFREMDYEQRKELRESNPTLYDKLTKAEWNI